MTYPLRARVISVEYSANSTELMSRGRGRLMANSSRIRPGCGEKSTTRLPRHAASRTLCVTKMMVCCLRTAPDFLDVAVELLAGQRIQRGKRLIHQQHARIRRQRASQRHSLLHPAGELMDIGRGESLEPHEIEVKLRDLAALLVIEIRLQLEAKEHIAHHIQPGKKRMLLEHHHAVASRLGNPFSIRQHLPGVRLLEPRDDVEQRRFAAPAGAHQADKFPLVYLQGNIIQRPYGAARRCGTPSPRHSRRQASTAQ